MIKDVSILIYVQHLVGSGHTRRMAVIARELAATYEKVFFVCGGEILPDLDCGNALYCQLPAVKVMNQSFDALYDTNSRLIDNAFKNQRKKKLLALLHHAKPSVVITETYPFGRNLMRFELEPLLEQIRLAENKPILLCSIRDIVEPKSSVQKEQKIVAQLNSLYDGVLVHGDSRLIKLNDSFSMVRDIEIPVHYTGYIYRDIAVLDGDEVAVAQKKKNILVACGGGAVGEVLVETALLAAAMSTGEEIWHIVTGPLFSEKRFKRLKVGATRKVKLYRHLENYLNYVRNSKVLVMQAGYNSVVEGLMNNANMFLVPYEGKGEKEQTIRAKTLSEVGLAHYIPQTSLSAELLLEKINSELDKIHLTKLAHGIDMDGAKNVCKIIYQAMQSRI